ncbi:MAG: hypothetical protein KBD29_03300 [Candidatus Magasanikbacteria bacterium]|nr:hypothetical protein [Candidatus Magasanikbacteria bacterium]
MELLLAQLHPVIVHFPIGLLTLYAVLELIPFRITWTDPKWIFAKRILVFCGTLAIIVAETTGEARGGENIAPGTALAMHELMAMITKIIFMILAGAEVVVASTVTVTRFVSKREWMYVIWKILERISKVVKLRPVVIIGALGGLICITITGALGGGMVYGPEADPMVKAVYTLFNLR